MTNDVNLPPINVDLAGYRWAGILYRPKETYGYQRKEGIALYDEKSLRASNKMNILLAELRVIHCLGGAKWHANWWMTICGQ